MKFNLKDLISNELINQPMKSYSRRKMYVIRQIKIFSMAIRGFSKDKVQLRASALTYYAILSIVPIVAMAFGIAKGFGFEVFLQEKLLESFSGQEKVLEWILKFVERYLTNINGGLIAGVGIVVLLWSVTNLLSNIESSFNDIWQIKKSRVMSRKLSDYVSLVVITPVLLFVSSSATIFLSEEIKSSSEIFPLLGYIGPILSFFVNMVPYVLIWMVFTLLYIVMPNTKVKFKSALVAGIIAGTMFQLLQWGYFLFQGMLTSYGAVYGSFAALPLFLMWMQLSWLIVLFGAEIAFANQNVEHYEAESEVFNISRHVKRTVTILLIREIVLNFKNSLPPATAEQLAVKLELSVRLVREILYELCETGIISETITRNVKENAYQPAIDIEKLSIGFVLDHLDRMGQDTLTSGNTNEVEKMSKVIDGLMSEVFNSKHNKLLYELK
jgi:membrane protein